MFILRTFVDFRHKPIAINTVISSCLRKMVVTKRFVLRKKFNGTPKPEDVVIVEENLGPLKDGGM